jgi:hypothetical protein
VNDVSLKAAAPLTDAELQRLAKDDLGLADKVQAPKTLATDSSVRDRSDLKQTGWGVLFASDLPDGVKEQLQPLLESRQAKCQRDPNPTFYREFTVDPGTTADSFAAAHKIDYTAPVSPRLGVPYYLLIVGSPESVSFEFQALLKMSFAVGRLYFDDVADYGRYAAAVVAYESAATTSQRKNAALWITGIPGDPMTQQLSAALTADFLDEDNPLGNGDFKLDASIGVGKATWAQMTEILRGNLPHGRPSVIFAGTHGLQCDPKNAARMAAMQGALITQDYNPATPTNPAQDAWLFGGGSVPADAQVDGTMVFLFACYGGGSPQGATYAVNGQPATVAANMIARLPQVLLSRGTLAVVAHVDMAFPYSFRDSYGNPLPQVLRDPLQYLMAGQNAGWAMESLTDQWPKLQAQIDAPGNASLATSDAARYSHLVTAKTNARNYILLGDPAVRLRVEAMS